MAKPEVLSILGPPRSSGAGGDVEVLHYWDEHRGWWQHDDYYVRFVGGKVESYGPESTDRPVTAIEPLNKARQ